MKQESKIEILKQKVRLLGRMISMFYAIDKIRDDVVEPTQMYEAIAKLLIKKFSSKMNPDLKCILALTDPKNPDKFSIGALSGGIEQKYAKKVLGITNENLLRKKDAAIGKIDTSTEAIAIRIKLHGKTLGAVVIIGKITFTRDDLTVLKAAQRMIDSAIIQCRKYYELEQKDRVNCAYRRIDEIRDLPNITFEEKLSLVAKEIQKLVYAKDGAIFLLDKETDTVELSATTNEDAFSNHVERRVLITAAEDALKKGHIISWQGNNTTLKSWMCLPLIMNDENGEQKIGVIIAVNHIGSPGFTEYNAEVLKAIGAMLDTGIFENQKTLKTRKTFGRMVGKKVMEFLTRNSGKVDLGFHDEPSVSVIFTDLRGFTKSTKGKDSQLIGEYINEHFSVVSKVIQKFGGLLNKYLGDGTMSLFNVPIAQDDYAYNAVAAAISMQEEHGKMCERWNEKGIDIPKLLMGIGICTGEAMAGIFGGDNRGEYTAIGDTVNTAARICDKANKGGNEGILIDEETHRLTLGRVNVGDPIMIERKPGEEPSMVYPVLGLN